MSFSEILHLFSYAFVVRAMFVGVLVSICAALLGVVLVLKHYSLIGHGLGDVGFASVSLAIALGLPPLVVSIPLVIIASFIIMAVTQNKDVDGDVAIGVAATVALAIGVIITSVGNGFNADISSYMFGSILAMTKFDVYLSIVLAIVVIGLFILFYNRIFIITVDETFAKASGINVTRYQFLIAFLTALTVVIGMKMVGTLLISSLIIFPAITARRLVSSFKALVITAAVVSIISFMIGIFLSFALNFPTGACIVLVDSIVLILSMIFSKLVLK